LITNELDHLDQLGAKAFAGFLVRKDLVRKYSRQYPVPTYVVEFLLGRYCASTDPAEIAEGLEIVEKQLQGRTVRTGEEELFKARTRDQGSVQIIDIVRAREPQGHGADHQAHQQSPGPGVGSFRNHQ